jgi:hypothetical protein
LSGHCKYVLAIGSKFGLIYYQRETYIRRVQSRLRILNGRTLGDLEGKYTFHNSMGSSTIDYIISSESFLLIIIIPVITCTI